MITRRTFLAMPLVAAIPGRRPEVFPFRYDHVLGTSLDLLVWTDRQSRAGQVAIFVLDEIEHLSAILKAEWYKELTTFFLMTKADKDLLFPVTRPTRSPERYQLAWDGRNTEGHAVPRGAYLITIEASRENGAYAKRSTTIVCADQPATAAIESSANWDNFSIQYGPRPTTA